MTTGLGVSKLWLDVFKTSIIPWKSLYKDCIVCRTKAGHLPQLSPNFDFNDIIGELSICDTSPEYFEDLTTLSAVSTNALAVVAEVRNFYYHICHFMMFCLCSL